MTKKKLVVIFGGRSSEHEVSCISVQTVAKAVDTDKYDMTLIGITKDGKWLKADSIESIADGSWYDSQVRAVISPDSAKVFFIKVRHIRHSCFQLVDKQMLTSVTDSVTDV